MMSLPRVLSLDETMDLQMEAVPQVASLRVAEQRLRVTGDAARGRRQLERMNVRGCCGEVLCRLGRDAGAVGLSLVSPGNEGKPRMQLHFDPAHPEEIAIDGQRLPLGTAGGNAFALRFYGDGSVIETFANQHGAMTKRFYYAGSEAPPIGIRVDGAVGAVQALSMWETKPISDDRLTA